MARVNSRAKTATLSTSSQSDWSRGRATYNGNATMLCRSPLARRLAKQPSCRNANIKEISALQKYGGSGRDKFVAESRQTA